jgi:hypothetical protein
MHAISASPAVVNARGFRKCAIQDNEGNAVITEECNAVTSRTLRRAVRDAVAATEQALKNVDADGHPQTQVLLEIIQQQAIMMAKYQRQLDATDARLTQTQKLFTQLVASTPVRSCVLSSFSVSAALLYVSG